MTLIELIIGIGLLSLITVGVSVVLLNAQKEQKKQALLKNLSELKIQFERNIKIDSSWQATMKDTALNPNLRCISSGVRCDGSEIIKAPGNYVLSTASLPANTFNNNQTYEIALNNSDGSLFYNGRKSTNNAGFTDTGQSCSGFVYPPGAGNSNCPIGYAVNFRALSNDVNPQILVTARMIYNPDNSHSFKNFINRFDFSNLNIGKYDAQVIRTARSLVRSFFVVSPHVINSSTVGCTSKGFGTCSAGFTNYTNYSEASQDGANDEFDLVDLTTTPGQVFIKQPGRYKCTFNTSAFAADNITAQLIQSSPSPVTVLQSQTAFAPEDSGGIKWKYANLSNEIIFSVPTGGSSLYLRQSCSHVPIGSTVWGSNLVDPNIQNCALGFADSSSYAAYAGGYSSVPKASLHCTLLE